MVKADETFAFCDQAGFTTYAGYNATINVIVICTNNAPPSRIAASFTHEAVHLAQDCKAGLHNADLSTSESSGCPGHLGPRPDRGQEGEHQELLRTQPLGRGDRGVLLHGSTRDGGQRCWQLLFLIICTTNH